MIRKEAEIFGLLFLGDCVKMKRTQFFDIMGSSNNITVAVLEIVDLPRSLS